MGSSADGRGEGSEVGFPLGGLWSNWLELAPVGPVWWTGREERKGLSEEEVRVSRLSRAAAPGGSKSSEFARLAELHFLPRRATFFLSSVPTSHSRASLVRPFGIASEVLIFHLGFYFFHAKSVAPSTHLEHRILNPITQPLPPKASTTSTRETR